MQTGFAETVFFKLYEIIWALAIPVLGHNKRIAQGFDQRILKQGLAKADIWIQAASVGESYLAVEIVKSLDNADKLKILVTTNTKQGIEILAKNLGIPENKSGNKNIRIAYFPFDKPSIIKSAVKDVCPRLMILLETEIWPALLQELKKQGCKIFIVNGRLSAKSLKAYKIWPGFWKNLSPDKISAISIEDADRFRSLFPGSAVELMNNIKFDRINLNSTGLSNQLQEFFNKDDPILVLGSVRGGEEPLLEKIILYIQRIHPRTIICIFPRHAHRTAHWEKRLNKGNFSWKLRSGLKHQVPKGTIILWDIFGELGLMYELAKAVFVGASLVPLGGQNFIEPLTAGARPVIGPFWKDFKWAGSELFEQGLVLKGKSWQEAAQYLEKELENPLPKETITRAAKKYLKTRQGGTIRVCRMILEHIGLDVRN